MKYTTNILFCYIILAVTANAQSSQLAKYLCERQPELQYCSQLNNNRVDDDNSRSFVVEGDETTTAPPQQRAAGQTPQQVADYCNTYSAHYDFFCKNGGPSVGDSAAVNGDIERAKRFCASYNSACSEKYKETLAAYCLQYTPHFQYYCKNPLQAGAAAVKFCPLFARECHADFAVPLLKPTDAPFTQTQFPQAATQTPPIASGSGGGQQTPDPAYVKQQCAANRALAQQYCFTSVGENPLFKPRCDLYKQYCV